MLKSIMLSYKIRKSDIKRWAKCSSVLGFAVFIIWYVNCLPDRLFNDPTSTVLLDSKGELLGAKIADDGQWRFSSENHTPKKFETCLIQFEDRNFRAHYGISIKGIVRALFQNIKHKKVKSGGSTLSMQLARIMRKNPPRTIGEKLLEMILATRIEIKYTKQEILNFYASNAPFGNNVVGIEAASWRYFGRQPDKLSWAESATLAVLPNAPGLIYPGKNHKRLLDKRNRLLKRLLDIKEIDDITYRLAISEPLPEKPLPLPQKAPHLLARLIKEGKKGKTIQSHIDAAVQARALQLLNVHAEYLHENHIYNAAIVITSVKSGKVLVYIGNTSVNTNEHGGEVDCIMAPRSTGSILKPFLYEKCLEEGLITPKMILPDVPSHFGNFSPKNFTKQYDGAVPADKVLARSLNIPMVRLLNDYGLDKFHGDLKKAGISTLNKPAKHYGLSLILGGAEAKLWDLCGAYTHMAQTLKYNYNLPLSIEEEKANKTKSKNKKQIPQMDVACIYSTFDAMVGVNRPDEDGNWRIFSSSQKIAWKTGTSFGFRDAWAIGVTPDYVVAVWVGNADGEGRPGITGIKAAAPILFDVFASLPKSKQWFTKPVAKMTKVAICRESGHRASGLCESTDTAYIPLAALNSLACPYHKVVHLSANGKYRVDSDCESVYNIKHVNWFVLPLLLEKYYKFNHPNYKTLPEYKPGCVSAVSDKSIVLLYPRPNSKIYVPIEIDGNSGKTIFEAAHRNTNTKLYWHLDDNFIGETSNIHQLALNPSIGKHRLLLVDDNGISVTVGFEALGK